MALFRDLVRNVHVGIRLALFLRVRQLPLRCGADQAVALLAIGVLVVATQDYVATGPNRRFVPFGLAVIAFDICVLLFACYVVARLHRATRSLGPLFVTVLCLIPAIWALRLVVQQGVDRYGGDLRWVFAGTALVWALALAWRAVRLLLGAGSIRAAAYAVIVAAGWFGPNLVFPDEYYRLWYRLPPTATATADAPPPLDVERTYYAQGELLDRATRRIERDRKGVTDLYFVGFAGDASQAVFRREVMSVRELFDLRFDTADRSVVLINHRTTVQRFPLANVPNLRTVLETVAERMDRDEDVLFLFLTSHGSRDHRLSVRFRPLGLNDLSPMTLRLMLERVGIKWRVIVVSACYSGGFIDALKNENTLVMTSARRDRSSFGCGDDNDFTYFGRAYFDEALQRTFSFPEAFAQARMAVAEREKAMDYQHSEPQIFVGEAIRPRLAALEARLATRWREKELETAERSDGAPTGSRKAGDR